MSVTPPTFILSAPFANDGDKQIISNTSPAPGRASLPAGFPPETSQPLNAGGVAPSRLDFNGILYMLSAFAFWQQSGGMWNWSDTLDYAPGCLILDNGALFWCVSENGAGTTAGAKKPSEDTAKQYWEPLSDALSRMGGGGVPAGTIIAYYGTTAPAGYLACDGSSFSATTYRALYAALGKTTLPDLRGQFIRGYDSRQSRALGTQQADAGRNITGGITAIWSGISATGGGVASGAFSAANGVESNLTFSGYPAVRAQDLTFSAEKSWGAEHAADEFRPENVNLLYCIKY